jgi:hypothetical protein
MFPGDGKQELASEGMFEMGSPQRPTYEAPGNGVHEMYGSGNATEMKTDLQSPIEMPTPETGMGWPKSKDGMI